MPSEKEENEVNPMPVGRSFVTPLSSLGSQTLMLDYSG